MVGGEVVPLPPVPRTRGAEPLSGVIQFNSNGRNAMMPGVMLQDTSRRGILDEYDEGPIY